jgi:hypothetical protein
MSWKIDKSTDRVTASFVGRLTAAEGVDSARAFVEALSGPPLAIAFDIREMTGYDSEARVAWQQAVAPKRSQILSLTVIGGHPLVKIGATTLALFLRIPHRFVDDPSKL